jgi:two-component system KDP operon response regulator KdpE
MPLVLLVDGEPVIRRLLEIDERAPDLDVETAANGRAALPAAEHRVPDAVVLDLGVVRRRRLGRGRLAARAAAPTPVMAPSHAHPDDAPGPGYPSDVQVPLTKPVDPVDLVETVRRVTRRDA